MNNNIRVTYFASEKCEPCKKWEPIVYKVCASLGIPFEVILKENDKENMFGRYYIMQVPAIIIFNKEKAEYSQYGTMSEVELTNKINKYLGKE